MIDSAKLIKTLFACYVYVYVNTNSVRSVKFK